MQSTFEFKEAMRRINTDTGGKVVLIIDDVDRGYDGISGIAGMGNLVTAAQAWSLEGLVQVVFLGGTDENIRKGASYYCFTRVGVLCYQPTPSPCRKRDVCAAPNLSCFPCE